MVMMEVMGLRSGDGEVMVTEVKGSGSVFKKGVIESVTS